MTNQEFFDKVWRGLKGQGFQRATRVTGGCSLYVQETGFRCAVGHAAESTIDGTWSNEADALVSRGVLRGLVERATYAHDRSYTAEAMESGLRACAAAYGLEVPNE
jgi:hypothetical protein